VRGVSGTTSTTWIETALYRVPLPAGWTVGSADHSELRNGEATITIRSTRRMPSIESFEGPGHVFRDLGQLPRAGWIEFEHADGAQRWLYRHEQFHRGLTPFVITLKAPLDQASVHLGALASLVEQLELTPAR
jgi:hypothetical protein